MEADKQSQLCAVRIPDRTNKRAQQFIKDGGAMNMSDLIRTALESKLAEVGY